MVTKKQLQDVDSFLRFYCLDATLIERRDLLEKLINFEVKDNERDTFIKKEYGEGNDHLLRVDYQTTCNKIGLQAIGTYIGANASPEQPLTVILKTCFIFSQLMCKELHINMQEKNDGHLYNYLEEREFDLIKEVYYHVGKLHHAIIEKDYIRTKEYFGDTLNYLMFLAHKINILKV